MDELHSHSILSYVGWRSKGDATYQKTGGRASVRAPVAVKLPSLTPHRKFGGNTLVAEMKTAEKDDDISAVILKPKFFLFFFAWFAFLAHPHRRHPMAP